ncbi:MAG: DNA-processing protein DprA [Treponema sp.]|jgi:DNA processing protein|nr:DNA-processing protein DprA [Treponema sp.]
MGGGKTTALLDLMICRIPNLKGRERIELQKKFDKEGDFSLLSKKDIENIIGRHLKGRGWTMDGIRAQAEADAAVFDRGVRQVSWRDDEYPPLLREIYDPPSVLFFRGTLPDPEKPLVAIVGTRKPDSQGSRQAYRLGLEFGKAGLSVVSGLALGIDAMAHRGNIDGNARTFAVLGSGVDCVYPASNRDIARRLLETGGALLSEYPPGTQPFKGNFPARNRIISALARGTIIVQAPEKSGALITAKFALEQGRDLWVDSAGLSLPRGAGTKVLAEEGAQVINSAEDVLAEWNVLVTKMKAETEDAGARLCVTSNTRTATAGNLLASSLAEQFGIDVELHCEELR